MNGAKMYIPEGLNNKKNPLNTKLAYCFGNSFRFPDGSHFDKMDLFMHIF